MSQSAAWLYTDNPDTEVAYRATRQMLLPRFVRRKSLGDRASPWEAGGLSSLADCYDVMEQDWDDDEGPPVDTGMVAVYRLAGVI